VLAGQLRQVGEVTRGRFAFVKDHVSGQAGKSGCVTPTVSDILFCTHPRYDLYLQRRKNAIESIESFEAVAAGMKAERLAELTAKAGGNLDTLFVEAKVNLIDRLQKSLDGDVSSDGFRIAAQECYCHYNGWRLHLETAKNDSGLMRPVIADNGLMTVGSIMLPFFQAKRTYTRAGVWKPVNSRALTIMQDAIEDATGLADWKAFSLTKANFAYITLNAKKIVGSIAFQSDIARDSHIMAICGLEDTIQNCLIADARQGAGMPEVEESASEQGVTVKAV
jgi:hypothetical protein